VQRSAHRVALDADDLQLHPARHRLLVQHEQDRKTLRTQDADLAQVQDDMRHPEQLLANQRSQHRRRHRVHRAADPHDHHVMPGHVEPQIHQLRPAAATWPGTAPRPLTADLATRLISCVRDARNPAVADATRKRRRG
jgi:hypothetical protein